MFSICKNVNLKPEFHDAGKFGIIYNYFPDTKQRLIYEKTIPSKSVYLDLSVITHKSRQYFKDFMVHLVHLKNMAYARFVTCGTFFYGMLLFKTLTCIDYCGMYMPFSDEKH